MLARFFRKTPRQPDLSFAADGFYPLAVMQINKVDADLHAIADGYADSLLNDGCSQGQADSANWGGATAIGQDLQLFESYAAAYDDAFEATVASEGHRPEVDPNTMVRSKYRAAATLFLSQILADAPDEYERFLKYLGR